MSQTEVINSILSRKLRNGVSQHVSGNLGLPGQFWITSSHRSNYENSLKLLTEYGGKSEEFARQVLESMVGSHERNRVFFYFTVSELEMKMSISTTFADHTGSGIISHDGVELFIDDDGHIMNVDIPPVKTVRHENESPSYFVFYLPPIAHILGKKK